MSRSTTSAITKHHTSAYGDAHLIVKGALHIGLDSSQSLDDPQPAKGGLRRIVATFMAKHNGAVTALLCNLYEDSWLLLSVV